MPTPPYQSVRSGADAELGSTEKALAKGMDGDYFSSHLAKLRKLLKQGLGAAAKPYLIDDGASRQRCYRLALTTEAVRFGELELNPSDSEEDKWQEL